MNTLDFIKLCKSNGYDEIQITVKTNKTISFSSINKDVENDDIDITTSYYIYITKDNKTINLSSEYLDESLLSIIEEKLIIIEETTKLELKTDTSNNNEEISLDDININDIKEQMLNATRLDNITYIENYLDVSSKIIRIINSYGVDISSKSETFEVGIVITASKDNKPVSDTTDIVFIKKEDINYQELLNKAQNNALAKLNERNIKSKKYNCIFKPMVVNTMLSYLELIINANNIEKDMTILKDKLNQKIFSDNLNIYEEPLNNNLPGYRLFDDEAVLTNNKEIITNGILKNYIYDSKTAKKANIESTGNSYNNEIECTNLYIKPGNTNEEDMIKYLDHGLIITDIMMSRSSLNPITGSFKGQAFGLLVENGIIVSSIKQSIYSTSLLELFNNIELIGNDLTFNSNRIGAVSLLIKDISFTGKED